MRTNIECQTIRLTVRKWKHDRKKRVTEREGVRVGGVCASERE
jgi:hypothetical protein